MNEIDDGYMLVEVDGVLQRRRISYYQTSGSHGGFKTPMPELRAHEILETTFDGTRRIYTSGRGYQYDV